MSHKTMDKFINIFLGKQLKKIRKSNNLFQSDMAKNIGVTQASYSRYESGKIALTAAQLVKISLFFKMTLDEILNKN